MVSERLAPLRTLSYRLVTTEIGAPGGARRPRARRARPSLDRAWTREGRPAHRPPLAGRSACRPPDPRRHRVTRPAARPSSRHTLASRAGQRRGHTNQESQVAKLHLDQVPPGRRTGHKSARGTGIQLPYVAGSSIIFQKRPVASAPAIAVTSHATPFGFATRSGPAVAPAPTGAVAETRATTRREGSYADSRDRDLVGRFVEVPDLRLLRGDPGAERIGGQLDRRAAGTSALPDSTQRRGHVCGRARQLQRPQRDQRALSNDDVGWRVPLQPPFNAAARTLVYQQAYDRLIGNYGWDAIWATTRNPRVIRRASTCTPRIPRSERARFTSMPTR